MKNKTTVKIKYSDKNYYQNMMVFHAYVRDNALCIITYSQNNDWYEERYIPLHRIDDIRIMGNNR